MTDRPLAHEQVALTGGAEAVLLRRGSPDRSSQSKTPTSRVSGRSAHENCYRLLTGAAILALGLAAIPVTTAGAAETPTPAFTVRTTSGDLWGTSGGSAPTLLATSTTAARYAPGATALYYATGSGLYRAAPDGTGATLLAALPLTADGVTLDGVLGIAPAPDGARVLITGATGSMLVASDGSVTSATDSGAAAVGSRWLTDDSVSVAGSAIQVRFAQASRSV